MSKPALLETATCPLLQRAQLSLKKYAGTLEGLHSAELKLPWASSLLLRQAKQWCSSAVLHPHSTGRSVMKTGLHNMLGCRELWQCAGVFFFLCHTGFDSEQCPENTIKHCTPDARGHAALSHLSPQPPFKQFPCQELDEKTDPRSHICITDMQPQPARTHLQDRYDVELLLFLNVPVPFGCTWMCFQSSQRSISYMQDFPLVC